MFKWLMIVGGAACWVCVEGVSHGSHGWVLQAAVSYAAVPTGTLSSQSPWHVVLLSFSTSRPDSCGMPAPPALQLFLLDAYSEVVVYASANAPGPFPPPRGTALRVAVNALQRGGRAIMPRLTMVQVRTN